MKGKKKIVEKLQKLIRMQTSPNINEVAAANKLLRKLMKKYEIDSDMLKEIKEGKIEIFESKVIINLTNPRKWVTCLAGIISNFYDCTGLRQEGRFIFIGFDLDRTIASKMFEYLHDNLKEAGKVHGKDSTQFCAGAVISIERRLIEIKEEQQKGDCGTALVVVKEKKIDDYLDKNFNVKNIKNELHTLDCEAYYVGKEYGYQVGLNQQIGRTAG